MLIDLTLKITPQMVKDAEKNSGTELAGHLGTHFDVMDKVFPLEYTEREGIAFDVSHIEGRDIDVSDIELEKVSKDMFVAFYSGYIESVGYGEDGYFKNHPQLSPSLINALVERGVSVIGLDFGGVRRGGEHTPTDAFCAERGTFIVENLCCLKKTVEIGGTFKVHTYPVNLEGFTGIPCRVIAQI